MDGLAVDAVAVRAGALEAVDVDRDGIVGVMVRVGRGRPQRAGRHDEDPGVPSHSPSPAAGFQRDRHHDIPGRGGAVYS